MIPKLLIGAGAMKAGTTWLYRQLQPHPSIHFTPVKELNYFSYRDGVGKQLDYAERNKKYQRALSRNMRKKAIKWYEGYAQPVELDDAWYCSLFKGVPEEVYCADFSNLYAVLSEESLAKITNVAEHIRVIYTLRDPLERLWSQVKFHFKFVGDEDGVGRMSDAEFQKMINTPRFWSNAEYLLNYRKLINVFGKERVHLFYLEDFVVFPQGSLWNLEKFLDIPHVEYHSDSAEKKINKTKELIMPDSWRLMAQEKLQPIYEELYAERLHHPSWKW